MRMIAGSIILLAGVIAIVGSTLALAPQPAGLDQSWFFFRAQFCWFLFAFGIILTFGGTGMVIWGLACDGKQPPHPEQPER